ncbi:MAG: metal ABC transporter permease [Solirubrobacterales bacterium]
MLGGSILAPLSGDFGLLSALEMLLIGGACGAVGVWILFFGRAILAESFTHALLPGLVIATMIGAGLLVGALAGVLLAYALLLLTTGAPRTSVATGNSVAVTTLVAIGALLASGGHGVTGFEALLFGDPLASSWRDVAIAAAFAGCAAITLYVLGSSFAALAFDPGSAPSLGINTAAVSAAALALLAVSVSIAANVAGTLLALALVTGPALGATALATRLRSALLLAAGAGALSGIAGLYLSYYSGWPAGASIALVLCAWAAGGALIGRRGPVARIV